MILVKDAMWTESLAVEVHHHLIYLMEMINMEVETTGRIVADVSSELMHKTNKKNEVMGSANLKWFSFVSKEVEE